MRNPSFRPRVEQDVEKWELSYTADDSENCYLLKKVWHHLLRFTIFSALLFPVTLSRNVCPCASRA